MKELCFTMSFMTIGQAVVFTGKSKTTIHKLTKKGTLSVAQKNEKGHNLYDSAELIRVFGEPSTKLNNEPRLTNENPEKERSLNPVFELLEQQNKELRERIEKLEEKNDKLTDELLNISKRLLPPPEERKEVVNEPLKRKKFLGLF